MEKELKIVVVEPFQTQEESTSSASGTTDTTTQSTTAQTSSDSTAQTTSDTSTDATTQSTGDTSTTQTSADASTDTATTQSTTDQTSTDTTTTQSTSDSTATDQTASDTSTDTATTQSTSDTASTQATTQTTSWETLGTKTFTITAEKPPCGIKIVSWNVQLLKNGSPISSGATVYTTDDISIKATFTVAPNGSGCVASGSVGIQTQLDSNNPSITSKSITGLTAQTTYTVTKDLGNLPAGSHTIKVTAQYIPGPVGT